jgi:hypothetical protein
MIIWLASYPKSGNTWVRSIISSLLYSKDGNHSFDQLNYIDQYPVKKYFENLIDDFYDLEKIKKNWIPSQDLINLDRKIKFLKTHHIYCKLGDNTFTNDANSLGVIHIVRDPRNLLSSIKHHWSLNDYNSAKDIMFDVEASTGMKPETNKDYSFPVLISSWNNHYNHWKKIKKNYLLIRYEDLLNDTENELMKIIKYLKGHIKFEVNNKKIKNILKTTSFDYLKNMENEGLFKESNIDERTGKLKKFFNKGPENKWKNLIKKEIINDVEKRFYSEMKELGYID